MMVEANSNNSSATRPEPRLSAPLVYTLGLLFIILLMVCYIKADVVLGWMESLIKALFL